jgi:hypothetical protein
MVKWSGPEWVCLVTCGLWLATSNVTCVCANPAVQRLTGLSSDQINQVEIGRASRERTLPGGCGGGSIVLEKEVAPSSSLPTERPENLGDIW